MDKKVIMLADYLRLNMPVSDKEFDMIYPAPLREMSGRHFTGVDVAIKAARFLVTKPKQRVLDIGSGVGKFCFVAASYSDALYTGVDYRKHFVDLSKELADKYRFRNVNFIYDDITHLDFSKYDCFYFFNSFQEHVDRTAQLDHTIEANQEKYEKYSDYLKNEFEKLPDGTRIVTYHAYPSQIPGSYRKISLHFDGLLICWEKGAVPF